MSIFKSIENGDTHQFEGLVSELVNYLDSISEAAETELDNGDIESDAFEVLNEIYQFISSPLLDQVLFFFFPSLLLKFFAISLTSYVVQYFSFLPADTFAHKCCREL